MCNRLLRAVMNDGRPDDETKAYGEDQIAKPQRVKAKE
jgi:hypothetical protein